MSPFNAIIVGEDESGLTKHDIRPAPILFGSESLQALLLKIADCGAVILEPKTLRIARQLVKTGICSIEKQDGKLRAHLDQEYPAFKELSRFLSDCLQKDLSLESSEGGSVHREKPLGHIGVLPFRILNVIVRSDSPLDIETIRRRIPDFWAESVSEALYRLAAQHVVTLKANREYALSANIPDSFRRYVLRLAEIIADPKLAPSEQTGKRVNSFITAADGAPRLFGTDVRLRNLMALAVYGPMLHRDLRRITGVSHLRKEARDDAPFSRAGIVRTWQTPDGMAICLDDKHPLYVALRRLLVRLVETYPLAVHEPRFDRPDVPPGQAWMGDTDALFGGTIPTSILLSIGVLGWTFEALCCQCIDKDRVNIKKSMRRLEEEGILVGDRPRKPGMNIRIVRLADTFAARDELLALLEVAVSAWPIYKNRVNTELGQLAHKTKIILGKRGLI